MASPAAWSQNGDMNKMLMIAGLLLLASASACGGSDDSSQSISPVVAGSSCTQSSDCATGQVCGFATADACAAKGVCLIYPIPGTAHCNSIILACGCAGEQVAMSCDFPSGYAPSPVRSTSALDCTH